MTNSSEPVKKERKAGPFARRRQRRLMIVIIALPSLLMATFLTAVALRNTTVYFYYPKDMPSAASLEGREVRLGGMVEAGSLKPGATARVSFAVTDFEKTITVIYDDLLPPLFKDGEGVIVQGTMGEDGVFVASEVMAKHDEDYMPPELADLMEKAPPATAEEVADY